MEGCPSPERLQGLRDPALAPADRDALTAHAEHCELCRATIVALFAAEATAPPTGLDDGERLERYVIEGKLGAGAMGVVYAARDPELGRKVAIKLLHAKVKGLGLGVRLQREAQALARVSHPNVVAVHDVGTHHGDVFIAMELVRGETLRAWLARGQPVDAILARLVEAGRGLAAVHAAGLVHRDFKPDNVLVGDDGRARVTDFGLARLDDDVATAGDGAPIGSPLAMTLTHTGTMLGTPVYAAPEQLVDARVDARADQFAFCATAYEALYGVRPYAGDTIETLVANARRRSLAPPVREAKVPSRTHEAIVRGLAADPAERHATLEDLLHAFERPVRRGVPIAIAGAIGAVAIGVGIVIATRSDRAAPCDARAELASIWNAGIAKRATDAATKTSLDQYASAWTRARDQACRAKPDAARTACLEQAREQLGAVARYVTTRPADPHELAALVARNLPPVARCETARGIPPKPASPELAGEVARIRGGIADVRAALSLDHSLDAANRFTEVRDAGAKLDYAPLRAELVLLEGMVALARGDQTAAVETLHEAISLAESCGHDRLKAEAAAQLGRVLVRLGKLEDGTTMLDLAAATVARSGENEVVEIDLANTRALLADARGATEDAIRMYRETIARYRRTNEVSVANTQVQLHMVLARIGRDAEAAEVLAASAATLRKYMPAAEAGSYVDQCNLALHSGDLLRATQMCRREAIEVELVKGPTAPETASALQSYALARELASDWQEARTLYGRSARIHEQLGHRDEAAFALERAGWTSLELDDHARAVLLLAQSVALAGANPAQHLSSRAALGRAYAGAGQHVEAIRELEWAIPKVEALEPPSLNVLASSRFALAEALWRRGAPGDRDRAREHARIAKEDAAKLRDKLDEQGARAIDRRRMTHLIARIDAWTARR